MRHVPLPFALLLVLTSSLSGCGSSDREEEAPRVVPERLGTPEVYELADPGCTPERGAATLERQELPLWDGQKATLQEQSFPALTSANSSLRGPVIAGTWYGLRTTSRHDCEAAGTKLSCGNAPEILASAPRPLALCRSGGGYPVGSVEATALASAHLLESAHSYYQTLDGRRALPGVELHVLPRFEKELGFVDAEGRRRLLIKTETDNAAWALADLGDGRGSRPIFYVLPRSKEAAQKSVFGGANLWELPFVMAHEFGHHAFYATARNLKNDMSSIQFDELTGIRAAIVQSPVVRASTENGRAARWRTSLLALNEAMADLFGYYATGATLSGVTCLEISRDPASPIFADGTTRKRLTAAMIAGDFSSPERSSCEQPDLNEEHALGAVFAHGFDRLFTLAAEGKELTDDAATRYKASLLLGFLTRLDALRPEIGPGEELPGEIYVRALEAALRAVDPARGETLGEDECEVVATVFPGLEEPLAQRGLECGAA
jgi:hypothetical protein